MLKRILLTGICLFTAALSVFFPVLASHERQHPSTNAKVKPLSATLIINEYLADPPDGLAGDANGDGVRDASADEFVELVNNGIAPLDISLFTISDATQTRFTVPSGKVIPAGEAAVVFGGGTPTGAFGNAAANGLVFAVGGSGLSLNNGGDTITVKDSLGAVVDAVTFGATEGGSNQSITRSPDITGPFVEHSTAAGSGGALFSPGTRVNGAPFTTTDPVIASISPAGAIAGAGDVFIDVVGMNFHGGAEVRVDGNAIFTAFFSDTDLNAVIPGTVTNVAGSYAITVRNPDGAISNSVPFTVLASVGINEYLADPPDGLAGDANGDGVRDSADDEFVEIMNRTDAPVDIGSFTISDADAQRFVFPPGTLIPAGEVAVVFGGGHPQGDFGNAGANGLVFTAGGLSLNNTGDTITLKNSAAAAIESVTFGSSEGGANQSLNRNPDGGGITFVPHSTIPGSGGRLFSPGAQVNGTPFTSGPRLTSISPTSANQGSAPFDLTVQGSDFDGGSKVLIDAQVITTAFVDPGRLIGHVPASVLAVGGAHQVQVRNEGGNRSNALTLTILIPPPTLTSITPRVVVVGSGALTLFASGANFVAGAVVLVDGTSATTTFTNSQTLRATVPASFLTTPGTKLVSVRNPDGKLSSTANLEVILSSTVVSSILPATAIVGGPGFSLSVKGSNFKTGVVVFFDQTPLVSHFTSSTQLTADVPASLISALGVHAVSAQNLGESPSNEVIFQVLPDPPLVGSLDPPSVIAGAGDLTVTITGERFQPGAVVLVIEGLQGEILDTTVIDGRRLQARVPAALIQAPSNLQMAVVNPDSGTSNVVTLRVFIKDPLVINEYLADPPAGGEGDANGDGTRSSSQDEFVEMLNRSADPIDISGYKLFDADDVRHVFAPGTIIPAFEVAVVFGGGTPTGPFGNAADNHLVFKASTGGLSLNNGGDSIVLQDAQGHVVQQITFGSKEGGASQSLNRDPDGDGATFTLHSTVAADPNRLFSPGTRAAGQTFTIKPTIRALSPGTVRVGSSQFTLNVSGTNFLPGAVVLIGNTALETVFRSDTQLEATVAAGLVAEGGAADVRVKNPRGELSSIARLLIVDDPPKITRITPQTTGTGADKLEVTITGERFQRGAGVSVQGVPVTTTFVSSTTLIAIVPNTSFTRAADLPLLVVNSDGNQSNALTLTVENGPLITRLARGKIKAGTGAFEISVGGVAFKPGVVLYANETALSTTFVSEASFTARIPAEMTAQPGVLTLQARHLDGGRSNTVKLKVIQ
jgi:lamin tail-like protein/IPT/TIG domain-containing protein